MKDIIITYNPTVKFLKFTFNINIYGSLLQKEGSLNQGM